MLSDQYYMELAIALARQGVEGGHGGPFGAVVVKEGEVIGQGHNSVLSKADPTAHAEVVAIREACSNLGHFQLEGCTLYTSCEPCPMCLGAIYWARPARVVYACTRGDAKEAGFDDDFIYQELELPLSARSIPMEQQGRAEALQAMQAWKEKEDKTPY
ncbi:nucleoside deaminase [Phaeodactylibacter luteus]|uniref:Nucleoside deaminase n=1 Tax=Phaeodactylibacter luteus TaxID=1564516 RepID=A0A5C6RIW8_9BACT|nr:nucleoside deaminase [Phaeodactylibacter luteus]TXB61919.1 nucleoside deaminase [Phaeodactylibacter luteus]